MTLRKLVNSSQYNVDYSVGLSSTFLSLSHFLSLHVFNSVFFFFFLLESRFSSPCLTITGIHHHHSKKEKSCVQWKGHSLLSFFLTATYSHKHTPTHSLSLLLSFSLPHTYTFSLDIRPTYCPLTHSLTTQKHTWYTSLGPLRPNT